MLLSIPTYSLVVLNIPEQFQPELLSVETPTSLGNVRQGQLERSPHLNGAIQTGAVSPVLDGRGADPRTVPAAQKQTGTVLWHLHQHWKNIVPPTDRIG